MKGLIDWAISSQIFGAKKERVKHYRISSSKQYTVISQISYFISVILYFILLLHKSWGYQQTQKIPSHCVQSVRIQSYSGLYSVRIPENTDQNNSEYGHFLRSVC